MIKLWATGLVLCCFVRVAAEAQQWVLRNAAGLQVSVDQEDRDPAIHVVVPGGPAAERSFNILMPEHVTVREAGQKDVKHLYIFQPGLAGHAPVWHRRGDTLEYAGKLGGIDFSARATLQGDGILFHYEFVNHSDTDYEMAWGNYGSAVSNRFL